MDSVVRYSEAFKLQVVREIEEGKHPSCFAARERYGISGAATVARWVREYGRTDLLKKVVHVQTTSERDQMKTLKARVRELEKALCDAHLDLSLEQAWMRLACKAGGIEDVEGFKKKHLGMLSTVRGSAREG